MTLDDRIKRQVEKGDFPQSVQQAMDVLRVTGNDKLHEITTEDNAETTAALFELVNLVVDQLIAEPKANRQPVRHASPVEACRDRQARRQGLSGHETSRGFAPCTCLTTCGKIDS